ncbi:hypothetical protein RYX36_006051 [Vicia faba]
MHRTNFSNQRINLSFRMIIRNIVNQIWKISKLYEDFDSLVKSKKIQELSELGCGKFAAIYVCAKEQGLDIVELNESDCRNGTVVKQYFGDSNSHYSVENSVHDDIDFVIPLKPPDQIVTGFLCCGESKFQRFDEADHLLDMRILILIIQLKILVHNF